MRRILGVFFVVCGLSAVTPAYADTQAGHITWESWSFDWEIEGNTALELHNVLYANEQVLAKASLPVIRVKYIKEWPWWHPYRWFGIGRSGGKCGPFQDRITWSKLQHPVPICQSRPGLDDRLCLEWYTVDGVKWLEFGVYARIGEYHIYQAWLLSEDGEIRPIVESRGLSCKTDHIHHPYWRLHFAINGSVKEQVFVHNDRARDEGWGPGWHKYTNELDEVKNPATNRVWFVRDNLTGHGVWVMHGLVYGKEVRDDGVRDRFSNRDVSVRLYHEEEDVPWLFGADGDLGYSEEEPIQEEEIVFWYIAHLPHTAVDGPAAWLTVGPVLKVQR